MTPLKRLLLTFAVAVSAFVACSPAPAAGFVVQANGKALQRPTYAYVAPAAAKLGATIGRANVGAACDCSTQIVNGSTTYCALAGAQPVQLAVCVPATAPTPVPPPAFSKIADEGSAFTIAAPAGQGYTVRYGAGSTWIARDLAAGSYTCDNATFTDPRVGTIKECDRSAAPVAIPPPPPPNVPPTPPHMHGGVQGIDKVNVIVASFDGLGFQPGTDQLVLSAATPLGDPASESNWEQDGAIRTFCKPSHMSNDDAIVYPGQPGVAHDHTFFGAADAFLTDANVRAAGNRSTCRGGTLDLTRRWVPSMYDTVSMKAIVPHGLLMYYKTGYCMYSVDCSNRLDFTTESPMKNLHWPPRGMHLIAGDPAATSDVGVTRFTCLINATGNGRVGASDSATIPKCMDDGSEALWVSVKMPNCLAVNADGTPKVDSPDHKSHAAYMEGWPQYNTPTPGKSYRCPLDHPYEIAQIDFKEIFEILPGMDTSKWNLSCGSQFCGHADWFDGWDQAVMVPTNVACLQMRRNCGSFQIFDGRTAAEFDGN